MAEMKDASSLLCEESEDAEDVCSSRSRRSGTELSELVELLTVASCWRDSGAESRL